MNTTKVLVFVPNYYPGFRFGGIARTIANTAEWLGDKIDFYIVTRDRDLGEESPYPAIQYGKWVQHGKSKVRYLRPDETSLRCIKQIIESTPHDIIHLNSFFDSVFTIKILFLMWIGLLSGNRLVLSPRGEFGLGSFSIKKTKKHLYLNLTKHIGWYNKVAWHASSRFEAEDISRALDFDLAKVKVAIDLPVRRGVETSACCSETGSLRVVFLSRLTREKNLDGALKILQKVTATVQFDIIGPKEDPSYWKECELIIKSLPSNILINVRGAILPDQVFETLSKYDLMLFPSHGENYGHVIAEAISVGTRVLISNNTPWRDLDRDGLGWNFENSDPTKFSTIIENLSHETPDQRRIARTKVQEAAIERLSDPTAIRDNLNLFTSLQTKDEK